MAVVASRFDPGIEFSRSEAELQDHVLDVYGTREHEVDLFRPNIADQHKVGFFTLDRCSQTEVTEVVDLKEMTEVLQILLQDVTNLRRDINLTKHVMQADYESKLQEKSLELYVRINEKVRELERIHEDRVTTVRRAFRQQLSDAIARVAVLYNKNLESKIKKEKRKQEEGQGKHDEKYKEMQATIQRNETVIQMLKMQLAQFQQRRNSEVESPDISSDRPSNTTAGSPVPSLNDNAEIQEEIQVVLESKGTQTVQFQPFQEVIEELSVKSKSPEVNEEFEALKEECDGLHRRVDRLEEALDIKENENLSLSEQINELNNNLEKEKIMVEQLKYEADETKKLAEKEKQSSKNQMALEAEALLAKQKQEMQRMMEEQIRRAKEEAENAKHEEAKSLKEAESSKLKLLMDQKKLLEQELMQAPSFTQYHKSERKKNNTKTQEEVDVEKYRKVEQKLRDEILRLKKEIERIHRTWEKKFAILQQSLHALKDESYIRQTLQRQAAALHHAAVSYAVDTPVGIVPQKQQSYPRKPVIPDIPKKPPPNTTPAMNVNTSAGGMGVFDKDYISYTVSAPSGRGTAMLSVDENQVMSDGEQMPEDVEHIPPPPSRRRDSPEDRQIDKQMKGEEGQYYSQSQAGHTPTVVSQ
ncbi:uncharacterized protein C10orf67, mitochondrial-like isoform X5 [Crassostrea angulata]|uniref:uncharacterized protein C10orf67, mitochondrial-like isoform X5 n=1 Tax=Magallana angulata TaxID=2784310 RepID=UPI0022B0BF87|nr:uncharacterized protein C10orf67, mitochondrial-like isoform X5 [Crassostrea angulata]